MPRSAPRPQPAQAPGDQAYGAAGAQIAAQQQMPLPDMRAPGGGPAPAAPGGPPGPDVDPAAAALQAAMGMAPPEPPPWAAGPVDENIHAGLPIGPGPGPEALGNVGRRPAPVADMLLRMADATGDPYLAEMAQAATEQGA